MFEEIAPIQFIEGINEGDKNTGNFANTQHAREIAMEYTPKTTYSLNKMEINFACPIEEAQGSIDFSIVPDYKGSPSTIKLVEGTLITTDKSTGPAWHSIEFPYPAVVIKERKYWINMKLNNLLIFFPITEAGEDAALKFYNGSKWVVLNTIKTTSLMVKFYGRVLPFN